jgi:hypothetical protein
MLNFNLACKVVDIIEKWLADDTHFKFSALDSTPEISKVLSTTPVKETTFEGWLVNAVKDSTKSENEKRRQLLQQFSYSANERSPNKGQLNCFRFLLFAGFIAGAISLEQLENFFSHLLLNYFRWTPALFTNGELKTYDGKKSSIPQRGDFVIFNDIEIHTAIATGNIAKDGSPEILHFGIGYTTVIPPVKSSIKIAIADIKQYCTDFTYDDNCTYFASPPWTNYYFTTRLPLSYASSLQANQAPNDPKFFSSPIESTEASPTQDLIM